MVKRNSVNFIIDLSNALEGSGIYSSATRIAQGLRDYGFQVSINGRKPSAIVHFHTALPQSLIRAKQYNSLRKKKGLAFPKIVIHGHTTVEDFVNSFLFSNQIKPILKRYLPYYYNLADQIIAVSEHNKNLLVNYGISSNKISVISNGIKLDSAHRNNQYRIKTRRKLDLKSSDYLIISLGISLYRKGIDKFVDIAKNIPNKNTKFVWIGKRLPTGFLAHSRYLKQKFIDAKDLDNCQFTGYVSYKTLIGLLNAADIFIYPTREENQGIAFLEAVLYGKPAIISNHPVFSEYENNIHVLKAHSHKEFIEQIIYLQNNPHIGKKLVENAQKQISQHDMHYTIEKIANLYSRLSGEGQ